MERRVLKDDFIELSKAKYGIFNVDEWKQIVSRIISKKVDEFDLTETDRDDMREKIQSFLYQILKESEGNFNRKKSGSLLGLLQRGVANATDIFGHLKSEVPKMTEDILDFMEDPENRDGIKKYVQSLINSYADKTFAEVDYTQLGKILTKYSIDDKDKGVQKISNLLKTNNEDSSIYQYVVGATILGLILLLLLAKDFSKFELLTVTALLITLLFAGLSMPMIDIDARVTKFSFTVLGEPVSFTNQVLYFKSKSILEVVSLLISQGTISVVLVGVLVFSFSVLFPFLKLMLSVWTLIRSTLLERKWVQFFVLKSGKWSMADVMVVAIFMSYIGFSSILSEQLKQIESISDNLEILTTNQSTLNSGFYYFTAFVILGLAFSDKVGSSRKS